MSLKAFHIFFILVCITLALSLGAWGVRDYSMTNAAGNLMIGLASFAAGVFLIVYLFWFFNKSKGLTLR